MRDGPAEVRPPLSRQLADLVTREQVAGLSTEKVDLGLADVAAEPVVTRSPTEARYFHDLVVGATGRAAPAVAARVRHPRAVAGVAGCWMAGDAHPVSRHAEQLLDTHRVRVLHGSVLPPDTLADRLRSGLLSFPVTHFDADLRFDETRYREHLAWQAGFAVAGLFAAGGTGEGFSLTSAEIDQVVRAAVDEVGGAVPVVAPATGSTAVAVEQARAAQAAGASGVLLFPPYLTEAGQRGLAEHIGAVCRATELGVIVYSRANAILTDVTVAEVADRNPNLVGLKDGVGDIEQLTRTYAKVGERLIYIGGLPTAETFALPLLQLGVSTYSSALYNFLPEFALRFYAAVQDRDRTAVYRMLNDFVIPYLDIRNRGKGYAVSVVKAGLTAVGRDGGRVRPPLTDLADDELAALTELVQKVP